MGFEIGFLKENFNVSSDGNELFEKWNITIFEMNNPYNSIPQLNISLLCCTKGF